MEDGIADAYTDESGVDTGASTNESYDAVNNLYSNASGPDANTKLLIHSDDTDESTTFTDSSAGAHSVTANGNANHEVDQKKFNASSVQLDGTGDYLSIADHADFDVVGNDFTIEGWIRITSTGVYHTFAAKLQSNANGWLFGVDTSNKVYMLVGNGSGWAINTAGSGTALSANTWYHLALVKNGTTWTVYLDGVSDGSGTATGQDLTDALLIGSDTAFSRDLTGFIDEVRYSNTARYTSNFTPPSAPFAGSSLDMTLISQNFSAESAPGTIEALLIHKPVDAVTLNTDLTFEVSRNGGTNYTLATLVDEGEYETGVNILRASVDVSGQPSATNIKYRLKTLNNKDQEARDIALGWA